jgi:phage repressor protein C with HTH and peptisase S24 domain
MDKTGMSQAALARASGVSEPKVKSYFQGRAHIPRGNEIELLARAIKEDAFFIEHGFAKPNAKLAPDLEPLPPRHELPRDVPVMGSGTAGLDGAINMDGPVDYIRRPPSLAHSRDTYAVFVTGDSMEPRYHAGDPVFVSPSRPVRIGDHVVVQCRVSGGDQDEQLVAFVKKVSGKRGGTWLFTQYNPEGPWIAPGPVETIDRIFTLTDLYLS